MRTDIQKPLSLSGTGLCMELLDDGIISVKLPSVVTPLF